MKSLAAKLGGSILTSGAFFTVVSTINVVSASYHNEPGDDVAGIIGFMFICGFYIFILMCPFIINLALAYYVYNDAVKMKIDNPMLWAIVTFFFNVIGLVIYYLGIRQDAIRKQEKDNKNN